MTSSLQNLTSTPGDDADDVALEKVTSIYGFTAGEETRIPILVEFIEYGGRVARIPSDYEVVDLDKHKRGRSS
jgi:hypothetical protein